MNLLQLGRPSVFAFAIVAALATLMSQNVRGANILLNGSFESPVVTTGTFQEISPGGEPAGFDWNVATGNIDLAGPNPFILYPTYDGAQAVDLNGIVRGSLYQDFPTVVGEHYSLTFAYADQGNRVLILGKTGQELFKGAFAPAASLAFAAEASF
jgi:hypothetical protein